MSVSARRMTDGPGGEPRFHYLVRWRDGRRIEHARMFPTEGEAAEFDADVKAGRLEPGSRPRRQPSPTFRAEAMDWLATKQATKQPRTAARYESHLRLHVLSAFGPTPVAAITRRDVQQWINTLTQDNLSASTIGDIYRGVFKPVLNKAILDGRLAVSPCHRIELPQPAAEEVVPPTPEQVLAVIAALPVRYRAMAAIAAGAGARISEAAGITISRLRSDPVRLRIDRQLLPARRGTGAAPGGCRHAGAGPLLPRAVGAAEVGRRGPRPAGARFDCVRRGGALAGMRAGAVRAAIHHPGRGSAQRRELPQPGLEAGRARRGQRPGPAAVPRPEARLRDAAQRRRRPVQGDHRAARAVQPWRDLPIRSVILAGSARV